MSPSVLPCSVAWDPARADPCRGCEFWIHREDVPKVGSRIVEHFSERSAEFWFNSKQHLSAIRMLCDWLVVDQVLPGGPGGSIRGGH